MFDTNTYPISYLINYVYQNKYFYNIIITHNFIYKIYNMKYLITSVLIIICLVGKSQSSLLVNDKLNIDSLYSNKDELTIHSGILEFEGLTKEQLKTKVKNWGGTKFVSLKEVLVSETEDQIVLNYIDKNMFMKTMGMKMDYSWYIRLVIEFKDGKIRCQYFDDGNTYQPSDKGVSMSSRSYHLVDYFKESDGIKTSQKMFTVGMVSLKESILKNFSSIKEFIDKKESDKKEW